MHTSHAPTRTLVSIQYLRGLAALAVVAEHTCRLPTELGRAGVDVFFVISGFIMMHVSGRERSPAVFLRARVLRLAPLYWLVTLVAVLVLGVTDRSHILMSIAFLPHVSPDGRAVPVVVQGWSLNMEMQFYVLFAVTLLLPAHRRLLALTAMIGGLAGFSVVACLIQGGSDLNFFPVALELPAGAWLCRAWQRDRLRRLPAVALLAAGSALLLAQAGWSQPTPWRCVLWGIPALAIVAGAVGLEENGRLPVVPGLRALGDASYSLYLTHLLLLTGLRPVLRPLPGLVAVPTGIAASVALGFAVHRLIERPLHRALRPARATAVGVA